MKPSRNLLAACLALASSAFAQDPDGAATTTSQGDSGAALSSLSAAPAPGSLRNLAVPLGANPFSAPITTGVDDNGFRYGTWASGPDFKVSFHDGIAFYPVLGPAHPDNLPLHWRTVAVTVGEQTIAEGAQLEARRASDWRYEYRSAAVTEAYDVDDAGVHQSFVIAQRPLAEGDLVVAGRITTELRAAPRGFAHGAIEFRDANGKPIVRYGAATAVDASGRTWPMATAFDGTAIRLRLDATAVAAASYPLVVDPLLGNLVIAFGAGQASFVDVARDDVSNDLLTIYGRISAGSDYDCYARRTDSAFGGSSLVWTDVTANWSTRYGDVACVGGADRWILVVQRDFPGTTGSWLRFHTRDVADHALSTSYTGLAGATNARLTNPDVGGAAAWSNSDTALVVYQSDAALTNTSSSTVFARTVNVVTNAVGAAVELSVGANFDRETPSVNQVSAGGNASWICAWTQYDNNFGNDDWDAYVARIDANGNLVGSSPIGNGASTVHAFMPRVAGQDGRYLVSYGQGPNGANAEPNGWADQLWAQRIDWPENANLPTKLARRLILPSGSYLNGTIAFDTDTRSHWALACHTGNAIVQITRVGYDARVCESVTVTGNGAACYSPGITYDDDSHQFPFAYASLDANYPVYGNQFDYPTFAQPLSYGVGCGPAILAAPLAPHHFRAHSGNEFFAITASNVPLNAFGALNIGLTPDGAPIPGLNGCFSNVGTIVTSLGASAMGTMATINLPIPGGVAGDLFMQYLYVDPGSPNQIPVSTTNGLQIEIR